MRGHVPGPLIVPARLVWDQHRVHAWRTLPGKVLQKHLQCAGIRSRQSPSEGLVRAGTAGGEQIQALEALIDHAGGTHPALRPDPGRPPLLAKARFVLAPELKTRLRMRCCDGLQL